MNDIQEGNRLTPDEYKELNRLLGKVRRVLKYPYCIVPECIQDLCHIALYGPDGKVIKETIAVDIEKAINNLTQQS